MVKVVECPFYSIIGSERSGFLNPVDSVVLRDASINRYRALPRHPWKVPVYKCIRENMGKRLTSFDLGVTFHGILLSQTAFEILEKFLDEGGELLPIVTEEGEKWYLFFMSELGPLATFAEIRSKGIVRRNHDDMPKPLPRTPKEGMMPWRRVKGRGDFVRWYEFDEESIGGRYVFPARYSEKPETAKFVSHDFMRAAIDHGLKGLDYHVTTRPEGPFWHSDPRDKDFPFWY